MKPTPDVEESRKTINSSHLFKLPVQFTIALPEILWWQKVIKSVQHSLLQYIHIYIYNHASLCIKNIIQDFYIALNVHINLNSGIAKFKTVVKQ